METELTVSTPRALTSKSNDRLEPRLRGVKKKNKKKKFKYQYDNTIFLRVSEVDTHLSCRRTEALREGMVIGGGVMGSSVGGGVEHNVLMVSACV